MSALAYRLAEGADLPFVFDSWINSYRTSDDLDPLPMRVRNATIRAMAEHYAGLGSVEIWVAYHPGESGSGSDLYGWLALDRAADVPTALYAYVKQPYRRMGIARGLLAAAGLGPDSELRYRHKTGAITFLRQKMPRLRSDRTRASSPVCEQRGYLCHAEDS